MFNYLPLTTTFFMACCLLTFLAQFFVPEVASTATFSIMPVRVVFFFEWYRLVSSAFFHGGLMHIGFNMMSLYALGTSLVRMHLVVDSSAFHLRLQGNGAAPAFLHTRRNVRWGPCKCFG